MSQNKSYSDLLRDPRWQKKRLEILERDDFTCTECEETTITLHVHHKKYRRGAKPWEYENDQLATLCERCHEYGHNMKKQISELLDKAEIHVIEEILGYFKGRLHSDHVFSFQENAPEMISHLASWNECFGFADAMAIPRKHMRVEKLMEFLPINDQTVFELEKNRGFPNDEH